MKRRRRATLFLSTFMAVAIIGAILILVTRGYRFDTNELILEPTGIFVATSSPNGAQVFIDGELKTATNNTISLRPDTYDVTIKKEGYQEWQKRLQVKKEEVTQADATLFPIAPSFTALTFSGAIKPATSPDGTKLGYIIPPGSDSNEKAGLWVMELVDLPLGFSRDPRQITNGDLTETTWEWSPDGREILLTSNSSKFLLDVSVYTPQPQRINVIGQTETIMQRWQTLEQRRLGAQLQKVPEELRDILQLKALSILLSPDELKVLYSVKSESTIPDNLIPQLPGSSTQKQTRNLEANKIYIYDIKEDRNFEIPTPEGCTIDKGIAYIEPVPTETQTTPTPTPTQETNNPNCSIRWLPGSRHVIVAQSERITVSDYDGTNTKTLYSGNYVAPYAYPYPNGSVLVFPTTLGRDSEVPNLYTLSLR